jgi:hypothetical protein
VAYKRIAQLRLALVAIGLPLDIGVPNLRRPDVALAAERADVADGSGLPERAV